MKKRLIVLIIMMMILLMGCSSEKEQENVKVNIGSLKGPTSIGLMELMDKNSRQETQIDYSFSIATTADELLPKMISGELDICLVPSNVASVLYNKTEGGAVVLNINTLGVLYAVSGDTSISTIADLKGKDIYVTNKGTTPDYCLQYLLEANGIGIDEVNIEYKSEATEVAALLNENDMAVGILPQPFVTAATVKNEKLKAVIDLSNAWDEASGGESRLVTGVTVVRKEFLENHPDVVEKFLKEEEVSAQFANENLEETAKLTVAAGIIEKEPIALKAIPQCNITFIQKDEMKKALSGYLSVLYSKDPKSVGGNLPGEGFYYN